MNTPTTLIWFRRNLRLTDNTILQTAAQQGQPMRAVFLIDKATLAHPRQATFISAALIELKATLAHHRLPLTILAEEAETAIPRLAAEFNAAIVITDENHQPAIVERDNRIWQLLNQSARQLIRLPDSAILAKAEVMTANGQPFTNFTAYQTEWSKVYMRRYTGWQIPNYLPELTRLQSQIPFSNTPFTFEIEWSTPHSSANFAPNEEAALTQLNEILFSTENNPIEHNFPAKKSTSMLSPYLSSGLLSPRKTAQITSQANHSADNNCLIGLIKRDFYQQLLFHRPHITQFSDGLNHPNRPDWLIRWQQGQTGYPIIDAAMRELATTGWLHPKLRQITAAFFCRTLLLDYRLGEAWFSHELIDFDFSSNHGNWLAASGFFSPSLHFFNPVPQSQNIDPSGQYIRRHLPELAHLSKETIHTPWLVQHNINTHGYPLPMVDLAHQKSEFNKLFHPTEL